jgi:hypothetical protein
VFPGLSAAGTYVARAFPNNTYNLLVESTPFGFNLGSGFGDLSAALETQSDGGLSATAVPWLIPLAPVALVLCGRERAGWLAVPVTWPATQWYYSTLALPALTPVAAAILAIPVPGAAVVAAVAVAVERRNTSIARLAADWRPAPPARGRLPDRPSD